MRRTRPNCAPRSSGPPPTSTGSLGCSRRCCAFRRSKRDRAGRPSRILDFGPILTGLAELYGAAAEERGLHLEVAAPAHLFAYGDRELIQQALANLLDNAVKFSPAGGVVRLSAAARPGGVEVAVADQGPGIPAPDREHATQRFFRGETARNTPGSGLGLALVQAVAQLHGGTLRLSDASPGLLASLFFPARGGTRYDVTAS